jgi:hypothetical protein
MKAVGFEVVTAFIMRSSILWDIAPCSPLKVNQSEAGSKLSLQAVQLEVLQAFDEVIF